MPIRVIVNQTPPTPPPEFTWTARTLPSAGNVSWEGVEWSPSLELFAAVGGFILGAPNRVMTSPDGVTWTLQSDPYNDLWQDIAWSPTLGLFAAVGRVATGPGIMTSPDGINWTGRTAPAGGFWWRGIVWADTLGLFVAVSQENETTTTNRVMTSPDGINWTGRTSASVNDWESIAWSSSLNLLVAVGASGTGNRVMTSPDGINWTSRASTADVYWESVAWSPDLGMFAAVSFEPAIMTSSNGIDWTSRTPPAMAFRDVTWCSDLGYFAACGGPTDQGIVISTDGINWDFQSGSIDEYYRAIAYASEIETIVTVRGGAAATGRYE